MKAYLGKASTGQQRKGAGKPVRESSFLLLERLASTGLDLSGDFRFGSCASVDGRFEAGVSKSSLSPGLDQAAKCAAHWNFSARYNQNMPRSLTGSGDLQRPGTLMSGETVSAPGLTGGQQAPRLTKMFALLLTSAKHLNEGSFRPKPEWICVGPNALSSGWPGRAW